MKKQTPILATIMLSGLLATGIWAQGHSHDRSNHGHNMRGHNQGHSSVISDHDNDQNHEHFIDGDHGPAHGEVMSNGLRQGGPGMQRMMQGQDTTVQEEQELALMFANHQQIEREVILLPNGIDTLTESHSPELAAVLVGHVMGMIQRADEGRDPEVSIQSPTLDILFENRDTITTEIEITSRGIRVIQTSTDPATVEALQTHAGEVTDMVNRGMQAIHNPI